MTDYSLPLVAFTTLSQTAVGLAMVLALQARGKTPGPQARKGWFCTGLIMAAALVASLFHLSAPMRAYDALLGLSTAWLSREVLLAGLFGLGILAAYLGNGNRWLAALTALLGLALVAAQGLTYASPAMPAIANGLPFFLFGLTVWVMGAALVPLLTTTETPSPCTLRQGLWMLVLLLLVLPCAWASGGTILRLSAMAWATSWFYWGGLACLTAALVFAAKPRLSAITAATLFTGIILTRLTFFGDTVSTLINIGKPY